MREAAKFTDHNGTEHDALVLAERYDLPEFLGADGEPLRTLVYVNPEKMQFIGTGHAEEALAYVPDVAHQSFTGLKPGGRWREYESAAAAHPGLPDAADLHYHCGSCGTLVRRTAAGKLIEPVPGAQEQGAVLGGDNAALWQEHLCKSPEPVVPEPSAQANEGANVSALLDQSDATPATPTPTAELTPAEKLAAGWTPLPGWTPPGVVLQLEEDAKNQPTPEVKGEEQK